MANSTVVGGPWTRHGHDIPGITVAGPGRPSRARCGGPSLCTICAADAVQAIHGAVMQESDIEVTITMRVPLSDRTYRRLKAAASLRGVGQGQLAAQIIDEHVVEFMNFNGVDEKFPAAGNLPGSENS